MEPFFIVNITVPASHVSGVYNCVSQKSGEVFETDESGGAIQVLKAYLPVMSSFGFTSDLRAATGGTAFPQMSFDHWDFVNSDPMEEGTKAHADYLTMTRKRKSLKDVLPTVSDYTDRECCPLCTPSAFVRSSECFAVEFDDDVMSPSFKRFLNFILSFSSRHNFYLRHIFRNN